MWKHLRGLILVTTKHKKLKAHTPSLTHLTALFPGLPGRASTRMPFLLPNQQHQSTEDKNNPPTTAAVSRPLYGSTCVSRHLQWNTGGYCWCKVLLPTCLADRNQHVRTTERMLEFSSTELSKLSMYLENNPPVSSFVDAPTHVGRHKHTYAIKIWITK